MEMPAIPSSEREKELNQRRGEALKAMVAGGSEVTVNDRGDIEVMPTQEQIAAAHKEMEKALAGKANVERHLEKVGKTVNLVFKDPVIFDSVVNKLMDQDRRIVIALDLPVLRSMMGEKYIKSARLKEISSDDGYVTFDWQGREYRVYGAFIEDMFLVE